MGSFMPQRCKRMAWRGATVVLVALLAPLLGGAAVAAPAAQPAGLTVAVEAGYNGYYKLGEWFPVRVSLSNSGAQRDVEVRVPGMAQSDSPVITYKQAVSLPAPARKEITLYTYAASYQHDLTVQVAQGDTIIAEQKTKLEPLTDAFLLGVVSDTPDLLNALGGTNLGAGGTAPATVTHLAVAQLPPGAGLGGLDALVVAGTDTSRLTPEQHDAIAAWTLRGGALVIAGGAGPAAGLVDLLPVVISGSEAAAGLDALTAYVGGTALPAAGLTLNQSRLRPEVGAVAVVDGPSGPILARRAFGAGAVYALALDPTAPGVKAWDRNANLWKRIFEGHTVAPSGGSTRRSGGGSYATMPGGMPYPTQFSPFDLPALDLPSVPAVAGFLFLYVLIVGPINYLLLRRTRRADLAWLTIPAIVVVFAALAYLLGYGAKGSALRLTGGSVIYAAPGASLAAVDSFVGLFSPSRSSYGLDFPQDVALSEISPGGGSLGAPGAPAGVYEGATSRVSDLHIDTWALRAFQAEAVLPYKLPIGGALRSDGATISGQLTNLGSTPLLDVSVVAGGDVADLGTLAPGQSTGVSFHAPGGALGGAVDVQTALPKLVPGLQLQSYGPPGSAAERTARRRAALLLAALQDRAAGPGEAQVLAWGAPAPLRATVPGQSPVRDEITLITTRLPLAQAGGHINAPPGAIPRANLSGNVNAETDAAGVVLRLFGSATFQYSLPVDIRVSRLTLKYALDSNSSVSGANGPRLELFNWDRQVWEPLRAQTGESLDTRDRFTVDIAGPRAYVNTAGMVQLRVDSGGEMLVIRSLDLGAEGDR
jgi:hypothetical protein